MSAPIRALVTGGSAGLGAALVARLLDRGDRVLVGDLNPPEPGIAADYLPLDVRSEESWTQVRDWVEQHWGGLDLLVNNAGVAGGGRIDVATMDEWEWITQINLFGVVRGCRTFAPMLKAQGAGTIVNVASLAGLVHPAGMGSYNSVKAGVVALTETLGHELAGFGIHCAVVCPSYFRTNLMDSLQGADTRLAGVIRQLVQNSPTTAEEVAEEILAGLDRGDSLILPDPAARAAYAFKLGDRAGYDQLMRAQAAKLAAADQEPR